MLNQIIQWSIRNRLIVVIAAVVLMAYGGFIALRAPVDENGVEMPAPEGAQDFIDFLYLSPSKAGNPGQPFYPGLVPGATSLRRSAAETPRSISCILSWVYE